MNIIEHYLKKNDCYKKGAKMTPAGILVHSTGCNNRNVTRYVDLPELGYVGNHWNKSGISKCVHFMLGWSERKGKPVTVQTLPLDMKPWGCGSGSKGSYNNSRIQFEICEGGDDKTWATAAYKEAVELCAYLCKKYGWPVNETTICSHAEAHKKGYASNHADADSYFRIIGKTMNDFRNDVKKAMTGATEPAKDGPTEPATPYKVKATNATIYKDSKGTASSKVCTGIFTITEVKGKYGRLKSGAGWLDLTKTTPVK